MQESLEKGKRASWDYQPSIDASRQFARAAVDPNTTATKAKRRFPFVPTVAPHQPRPPRQPAEPAPEVKGD
jgi:hypothetical protein